MALKAGMLSTRLTKPYVVAAVKNYNKMSCYIRIKDVRQTLCCCLIGMMILMETWLKMWSFCLEAKAKSHVSLM